MDTNAPAVVEHDRPGPTRWTWDDPHDASPQVATLTPGAGAAGRLRWNATVFPVAGLDEARDLVADLARADRIEDPDGAVLYRPPRVVLAVGDGTPFPFQAPPDWHQRIRALSGYLCHGPDCRPVVLESLLAMDAAVRDGWSVAAYDHLVAAERAARGAW